MSRPRAWLTVLGIAMSAAAVVVLFRAVDAADMWRRLRTADPAWFAAACVTTVAGYGVRAVRWGELLAHKRRPSLSRLFSATMVGFLAINTLPARLGELVRAVALSRPERISTATVLGSVAVERVLDLAALGAFWSLSLAVAPLPDWFRWSGYITLGVAAAVTALLWGIHRSSGWRLFSEEGALLRRLPERVRRKAGAAIPAFGEGILAIARPGVLGRSAALTAFMWVVNAAVFLMTGWALRLDLPIWAPLLLAFVVCVGIMVPSSPGFVGVMEGACVVGLGLVGIGGAEALAYGVLYHATQLLPLIVLGSWYALREHLGSEVLHGVPEAADPPQRKNRRQ
jgi:glycosyltransferase 2 family protein